MRTVKLGHRFHPHHPMIDGRDVVLAEDYAELERQLLEAKIEISKLKLQAIKDRPAIERDSWSRSPGQGCL